MLNKLVLTSFILTSFLGFNVSAKILEIKLPDALFEQNKTTTEIITKTGSFTLTNPEIKDELEAKKFLEARKMVLTKLATALQSISYGMGSIEWINEQWSYQKIKRQSLTLQELANGAHPDMRADILVASQSSLDQALIEMERKANRTLKEKAYDLTLAILTKTDQMLFNQKEVVAEANEFGFMASLGPQFIVGSNTKGLGGLLSLGFAVGYNKKTGAFFLDFFQSIEKFESTIMKLAFSAGLILKSGVLVRAAQEHNNLHHQSKTFYPPAIPGYANWSNSSFSSGFSSGLTIPPSPFGDLLTYKTETSSGSLIRIEISKVYPLWVRVKSPLLTNKINLIKEKLGWSFKASDSACEAAIQ